jgi:hypothetical protein
MKIKVLQYIYNLNLNDLIIKILQFNVLNSIHQSLQRTLNEDRGSELSTVQRQHLDLEMLSSERLELGGREEPPVHS